MTRERNVHGFRQLSWVYVMKKIDEVQVHSSLDLRMNELRQ